jgi:8-oxo-dGTP diphosphatase
MPGEELVAASVTTVDGRLLLVRRRIPEGELVWSLPAGKVERGESVEQAAIRPRLVSQSGGVLVAPLGALHGPELTSSPS